MSIIGSNILAGASGQGGGYTIENSLRFRSSASAYLSRTPASAGNRKTWTWSAWVKRGKLNATNYIFGAPTNYSSAFRFNSDGTFLFTGASSTQFLFQTSAVYRDVSAWYHIVVVLDTTQATSTNRVKIYINGLQVTAFITANYPSLNLDGEINNNHYHGIGTPSSGDTHDGYLTEVNFIDGQALDPSSFGEFDAVTGVWKPVGYTGTYGTNGFYLPFSDNTTTTTLVADSSGNGNNWTPNNISLTSGVTYDSMTDTPTPYAGGGNYCTLNPLMLAGAGIDVAQGNLYANRNSSGWARIAGSIGVTSGKWYWEITPTNNTISQMFGIGLGNTPSNYPGYDSNTYGFSGNGLKYNNATGASYGSYSAGQIVGVALDLDNGKIWFSCNGTWQASGDPAAGANAAFTSVSGTYFPEYGLNGISANGQTNFGQRPFAYTPPTGFKPLHTGNLPDSAIVDGSEYFDVVTRTGTGAEVTVTGLQFQPDLLWTKTRSNAVNHNLTGTGLTYNYSFLQTNTTEPENTSASQYYMIPTSDGYTVGTGDNINQVSRTFVDWVWKANGAGVSNTDGSITSTVSANPTAGFSVVTYTGTGTSSETVGHSLGTAPSMLIVKRRNLTGNWNVWHSGIPATNALYLNLTNGSQSEPTAWNSTAPTSSVFSIGLDNNTGNTFVAYCFAEVESYSKFGSYLGNGSSDGPFVYLGFRPAFVLIKSTAGDNWTIVDTSRNTYNVADARLFPSNASAEATGTANCDLLSNGFKVRIGSSDTGANGNGTTYIYMAFAENPFKNSLAR